MAEPRPTSPSSASNNGFVGRVRGASISLINANPQLGMWQAAGTAIAQAPNLTELRDAESGGDNIAFNAQGHSARFAVHDPDGELTLVRSNTRRPTFMTPNFDNTPGEESVIVADVDESIREVAAHRVSIIRKPIGICARSIAICDSGVAAFMRNTRATSRKNGVQPFSTA